MRIAVLKERAVGETRVWATPETVKKFKALGAEVAGEAGAGETASIADAVIQTKVPRLDLGASAGPVLRTVAGS